MSIAAGSNPASGGRSARLPVVAIIGRPNAGKSMLFNRLTRSQRAVVDAQPGITRDRNIAKAQIGGRRLLLVDTGGFDTDTAGGLEGEVRAQSEIAIAEADAIVLVVDGRAGAAPADREVAQLLRRSGKPVWLAVNKLDTPALDDEAADFFALGIERVIAISAAHGRGVGELVEEILKALPAPAEEEESDGGAIAVAIVGRPNVGKSSLLNRLVGHERSIVTPLPGTTRDAVDTRVTAGGRAFVLVDTAGVRRRSHVRQHLERMIVVRAFRALERSQVAVVVIDAQEGVTDQDARIAAYAWERGRALVVAVNKCDLVGGVRAAGKRRGDLEYRAPLLRDVPLVFISALGGGGVGAVFPTVERVAASHDRELPTARLNQIIGAATKATPPASVRGRRPTFQYAVQTGRKPPVVTIFCSAPELVQESYTRYLVNQLRASFDLVGTPVRVRYRRRQRRERK